MITLALIQTFIRSPFSCQSNHSITKRGVQSNLPSPSFLPMRKGDRLLYYRYYKICKKPVPIFDFLYIFCHDSLVISISIEFPQRSLAFINNVPLINENS